jgi:hypothetical protein
MPEELAHKPQGPPVQKQVHRKAVPNGMASDLERRLSPNLLEKPINVGAYRLARDWKDPLVLPKLPHPQVALDPGIKVSIQNRNKALGRALQATFARPPGPFLERLEDYPEVVAIIDETRRRDRQHLGDPRAGAPHQIQDQPVHGVGLGLQQRQYLGLEQVPGHGVEGFQQQGPLFDEPIPIDGHLGDRERHQRALL